MTYICQTMCINPLPFRIEERIWENIKIISIDSPACDENSCGMNYLWASRYPSLFFIDKIFNQTQFNTLSFQPPATKFTFNVQRVPSADRLVSVEDLRKRDQPEENRMVRK